jgi:hypothetical protein
MLFCAFGDSIVPGVIVRNFSRNSNHSAFQNQSQRSFVFVFFLICISFFFCIFFVLCVRSIQINSSVICVSPNVSVAGAVTFAITFNGMILDQQPYSQRFTFYGANSLLAQKFSSPNFQYCSQF